MSQSTTYFWRTRTYSMKIIIETPKFDLCSINLSNKTFVQSRMQWIQMDLEYLLKWSRAWCFTQASTNIRIPMIWKMLPWNYWQISVFLDRYHHWIWQLKVNLCSLPVFTLLRTSCLHLAYVALLKWHSAVQVPRMLVIYRIISSMCTNMNSTEMNIYSFQR